MCDECWTYDTGRRLAKLEHAVKVDDSSLERVFQTIGGMEKQLRSNSCNIAGHEQQIGRLGEDLNALRARVSQLELDKHLEDPFRVGDYQLCNSEDGDMEVTKDVGTIGTRVVARWYGTAFSLVSPVDKSIIGDSDFWLVVGQGYKLKYSDG